MSTAVTPSFVITSASSPENPANSVRRSLMITTRFGKTVEFQTTSKDKIKDMRDGKNISKIFLKDEITRFLGKENAEKISSELLDFSHVNEDKPETQKQRVERMNQELLKTMTPEQIELVRATGINI